MKTVNADYLVVGAGAMGMAFTDALTEHSNVRVALVDRRHGVGGHWLNAYPFVRLHQASAFYGVPSTLLGGGLVQQSGPEKGLHERATAAEVCAYYQRVLERMVAADRVEFFPSCDYTGGREFVSRVSGQRYELSEQCRIVDARYLAPDIPAEVKPPFDVEGGARVVAVNDLVGLEEAPERYVIVGSGKTATDACIWLLARGVDPDSICWIRPRDPWMNNRAVVQPNPAVFAGMVADTLKAAAVSDSLDDLFLRLEEAEIMLRIDPLVTPTMARTPTLATWELEQLRQLEHVVRLGHIKRVDSTSITLDDGTVDIAPNTLVVHCAAAALKHPPSLPIWGEAAITVQPIRAGFPCFGAGLTGYVEATREDDEEKNRICPPTPYPNSLREWAVMNVKGIRAAASFNAEPDIKAWANSVAINPAAVSGERAGAPDVADALARLQANVGPGVSRLAELCGLA